MVFLTGDTHIPIDIDKLDFPEQEQMTREDYVIVLGDFGLLWHWDKTFEHYLEWLKEKPYTLLWLDGNHENHEWIQSLPEATWHGGSVHYVAENIIHLARGSIFDIEGKHFFVICGYVFTSANESDATWTIWDDEKMERIPQRGKLGDAVMSAVDRRALSGYLAMRALDLNTMTKLAQDATRKFEEELLHEG